MKQETANQVLPGIYRLALPSPGLDTQLGPVNVYLIEGNNEYLLVDAGWNTDETMVALRQQLNDINVNLEDISRIVITHMHPDHFGLAGRLKELSNATIAIHHLDKELLEGSYMNAGEFIQKVEQWMHADGLPADNLAKIQPALARISELVSLVIPDILLYGGEKISIGSFNFRVLWTPGHCPGHISLYEQDQKILIAGDHLLPDVDPHIGLHPLSGNNPLGDYIKSLNKIKRLDIRLVLPGHHQPFTGIRDRIKEIIQHHKQRGLDVFDSLAAKPKTAYRITAEITSPLRRNNSIWHNLAPMDKRTAVLETLAYLEQMRAIGKVVKFITDGTAYYQRA